MSHPIRKLVLVALATVGVAIVVAIWPRPVAAPQRVELDSPHQVELASNSELDRLVESLGVDGNIFDTVSALHDFGRPAVLRLVEELHPVAWGEGPAEHIQHVIRCVQALRSLTAQRFTSLTSEDLVRDEMTWFDRGDDTPFFWIWMSRSRIYCAPNYVQRDIIRQWREWVAANPNFVVPPYGVASSSLWYF